MTDIDWKSPPVKPTPEKQPLSSERIYEIGLKHKRIAKDGFEWFDREGFARDIEAAHGITDGITGE